MINWDIRAMKKTVQSYSADYVPGKRSVDQPVYILTSGRTFSAAEEFTFDLKNLERATVVGDTTGGGGHTVASHMFDFDGFRIGIRLPFGRAYNPENDEGWEGVGVIPDIPVPADQALEVAQLDALRTPDQCSVVQAGEYLDTLAELWEQGTIAQRRTLLQGMIRKVMVDLQTCRVVCVEPHPEFVDLFKQVERLEEKRDGCFWFENGEAAAES